MANRVYIRNLFLIIQDGVNFQNRWYPYRGKSTDRESREDYKTSIWVWGKQGPFLIFLFFVLPGIRKQVSSQQWELEQIIFDLHFNLIIRKSLIIPKVSGVVPCPCDIGYKVMDLESILNMLRLLSTNLLTQTKLEFSFRLYSSGKDQMPNMWVIWIAAMDTQSVFQIPL